MKTFWTEGSINRYADRSGYRPHDMLRVMQKQFESDTGVQWSVSHQHGGYQFHPVDDGIPVASTVAEDDIKAIRYAYGQTREDITGYVSYLQISLVTRIGLRRLMPIIKWMEKQGMARRTVDRMGKGFAFKLVSAA